MVEQKQKAASIQTDQVRLSFLDLGGISFYIQTALGSAKKAQIQKTLRDKYSKLKHSNAIHLTSRDS